MGDSLAYNDSTGSHPAAPSPKHYGIDVSKCYVCNPDTPADAFDTKDPDFGFCVQFFRCFLGLVTDTKLF